MALTLTEIPTIAAIHKLKQILTAWRTALIANELTQPTISSGAGAPSSTPTKVGDIYVDTTNAKGYIATAISASTDWKILN